MTAGSDSSEDDKSSVDAHRDDARVKKTLLEVDAAALFDAAGETLNSNPGSDSKASSQPEKADPVEPRTLSDSGRMQKTILESNIPSLNQINERLHAEPEVATAPSEAPRRVAKTLQDSPNQSASNLKAMQDPARQSASNLKPAQDPARQSASNLKPAQDPARQSASNLKPAQDPARRERGGMDFAKPDLAALQAAASKAEAPKADTAVSAPATPPPAAAPRAMSKQNIKMVKAKKISNTMVDLGYQMQAMEPLNDNLFTETPLNFEPGEQTAATAGSAAVDETKHARPESTSAVKANKRLEYVPKTMLDHNMLFKAVSTSALREEAKVAAIVEERAKLPPKEKPVPIKADKESSPCPFRWDAAGTDEKYKFCTKCQLPVYNLAGMEKSEAEALIFKRENKSKFVLFGREDGKFTTSDCPVKAQNQKNLITSVVVGAVLIAGAVALLLMLPHQEPQPQSESPNTVQPKYITPTHKRQKNVTTNEGNRLQTFQFPDAVQNTDASGKPHVYDPDEDGSFWKFDN